jgi:indolepyruvate ferredoxin oxidoreductase
MSSALFNDHMPANFLILGAAYQAGAIPISAGAIERSIELNGVGVRSNLDAFRWGRRFVVDRASVPTKAVVAAVQVVSEPSVTELVDRRAAELVAYQNEKLASTYRSYVEKVAVAEQAAVPGSTALTEAVARHLFKLMAYKDEYEVARLYLTDEYAEALDDSFPTRQSVKIQLHPPLLRSLGVKRKIGFGPRSKPVLRLLRSLRVLRGTKLDPFGYTKVRRTERALIGEYRELLDRGLATLSGETFEGLVRLANMPDMIRGYEHIKLRNVEQYRAAVRAEIHER